MPDENDVRACARAFHGRFRAFAAPDARSCAERLPACGDGDGAAVWRHAAEIIEAGDHIDSAG